MCVFFSHSQMVGRGSLGVPRSLVMYALGFLPPLPGSLFSRAPNQVLCSQLRLIRRRRVFWFWLVGPQCALPLSGILLPGGSRRGPSPSGWNHMIHTKCTLLCVFTSTFLVSLCFCFCAPQSQNKKLNNVLECLHYHNTEGQLGPINLHLSSK